MSTPVYGEHMDDEAGDPARRLGFRRARQCVRGAGPRRARSLPMVKALLIPDVWAGRADHAEGPPRPLQLLQLGDGALGRAGGDLRLRRQLGRSPAWTATACAPCATPSPTTACWSRARKPAWCAIDETTIVEKGRVGPGQMIARRPRRGQALPRPARSWTTSRRRASSATGSKNITVIDSLVRRRAGRARDLRQGGAAPPPARRRLHHGGSGS